MILDFSNEVIFFVWSFNIEKGPSIVNSLLVDRR